MLDFVIAVLVLEIAADVMVVVFVIAVIVGVLLEVVSVVSETIVLYSGPVSHLLVAVTVILQTASRVNPVIVYDDCSIREYYCTLSRSLSLVQVTV